jgi:hypothetical protein
MDGYVWWVFATSFLDSIVTKASPKRLISNLLVVSHFPVPPHVE